MTEAATQLTVVERQPRSVLVDMSSRYGMEPAAFEATLRATVCKGNVSREEFAAFLLVAKEYGLNPMTKELYAFPAKGGGIQPIVSIDGWARIINDHPMFDGMDFEDVREGEEVVAITCRMHRKDRTRSIEATEYMSECRRSTDVWKTWPRRMLRHKAMIQCARYAFGFSGIVDPDEYERMESVRDVTPRTTGMRARLEARADASEGFDAAHVVAEIAPLANDDIPDSDAAPPVSDGPVPDQDSPDLTGAGADVFPGDRPAGEGEGTGAAEANADDGTASVFDLNVWANDLLAAIPDYDKRAFDLMEASDLEKARFAQLTVADMPLAQKIEAAMIERKREIGR
jgi:phage recombination protein Bet